MSKPLVSVICLCYNHQSYVQQAIESVANQTYQNVELIVVDDASSDKSVELIREAKISYQFKLIINDQNLGNCKSFNRGFEESKGKYIIDLAADDRLLPTRIDVGVQQLERLDKSYGVHYCDVNLISENGTQLGTHHKRSPTGLLIEKVPSGDIYRKLVERYFLCAPSMMIRRTVLQQLGGYDENLSYEDFDFWVRSSRSFKYSFSDDVLVERTILSKSLSSQQLAKKNIHAGSTAKICEKVFEMNENQAENNALLIRINYELKWALFTENWEAAELFMNLKQKIAQPTIRTKLEKLILVVKPPWHSIWKQLLKISYRRK